MRPWSSSMHGQINQGGLFSWASLSAKVLQTLAIRELVFRNRAGIPPTRREDEARGFACFASWLRQFVSAATNAAVAAARVWNHRAPYTFGPPRPVPPPPFHPSAVPLHARLLDDSRGRAFSSLFGPPSVLFIFIFCAKHAPTNADTRNTLIVSIDSLLRIETLINNNNDE